MASVGEFIEKSLDSINLIIYQELALITVKKYLIHHGKLIWKI